MVRSGQVEHPTGYYSRIHMSALLQTRGVSCTLVIPSTRLTYDPLVLNCKQVTLSSAITSSLVQFPVTFRNKKSGARSSSTITLRTSGCTWQETHPFACTLARLNPPRTYSTYEGAQNVTAPGCLHKNVYFLWIFSTWVISTRTKRFRRKGRLASARDSRTCRSSS